MTDKELMERASHALNEATGEAKRLRVTDDGLEYFLLADKQRYNQMLEAVAYGHDTVLRIIAPSWHEFEADFTQIKRVVSRMLDNWPNPSPQLSASLAKWMTDKEVAA